MATAADLSRRLRALRAAAPLLDVLERLPQARVVGGAVRDLLLGGEPFDLDVVVEGDAAPVAQALAEELGGELHVHDRFGTATVTAGERTYDVVRARAESYARPGALPDVRPGTLSEDLARRDFTVNALALGLDGVLHAVPFALEDLEARQLRVLHDASFRDDPTRLLRLVRYATRLSFAVEPHTAGLMDAAIADGVFRTVTATRIGSELRLLLREPGVLEGLEWIASWNGGDALAVAGLSFDRPLAERALALLPPDGRSDLLLLAVLGVRLEPHALSNWLSALGLTARERDTVVAAVRGAARVGERLEAQACPSAIAKALRGAPPELAALAGALDQRAERPVREWLEGLRHVRLDIDGDDLIASGVRPGEVVGRALGAALDAKLDGDAATRDEQLAVAVSVAHGG